MSKRKRLRKKGLPVGQSFFDAAVLHAGSLLVQGRQVADDIGVHVGLDQLHSLVEHIVVDAGLHTHLAHHVQHVLGGHVARGAGGEGAAAEAAQGAVAALTGENIDIEKDL